MNPDLMCCFHVADQISQTMSCGNKGKACLKVTFSSKTLLQSLVIELLEGTDTFVLSCCTYKVEGSI